ncbi:DUF4097 domain-containing protein [Pedobacter sp. MC2016-14]|uniref:DUF4097 family beta strand repeat-containing protein n=1 Tax=Pedobacter sp. MC2016-14 TaxID=2897327 RepID=UPI001E2A0972|nr:DUF4097 family beta strand repeat-containing protein [Pedobacter sp. MC2016-14]MCD0487222.1 DUF4097 domain-containing protein [Pedobacter sp. MC2016-14]
MKKLAGFFALLLCFVSIATAQTAIDEFKVSIEKLAKNITKNVEQIRLDAEQFPDLDEDEPVLSKTISKTFGVKNSDKIVVNNQYGSVVVKIWDRNEVKADVLIKAYSGSQEAARKLLDEVSIDAFKTNGQVSFKTKMEQNNDNWGRGIRNGKKWQRELRINYIIYMPAPNALDIFQTYGNIVMDDFCSSLYIKLQYGDFSADQLKHINNYFDIQYGSAKIGKINSGTFKQQYGGGLNIGSAEKLVVNAQYAAVNVGRLNGNGKFEIQYNRLSIAELHNGCKELLVNSQYGNVSLGFSDRYHANFDVQTNYGSFKSAGSAINSEVQNLRDTFSKNFSGKIGNGGSALVKVTSSYGSVVFR